MKIQKLIIFILIILISVGGILSVLILDRKKAAELPSRYDPETGIYYIEQSIQAYVYEEPMVCEWEYYPGVLLMSGDDTKNLDGLVPGIDHFAVREGRAERPNMDAPNIANSSLEPNLSAQRVMLPLNELADHNPAAVFPNKASFRIIISGLRTTNDNPMLLGFPSLINGNYRVYVNGTRRGVYLPNPTGYPLFAISSDPTAEIILEVSNSSEIGSFSPFLYSMPRGMNDLDIIKTAVLLSGIALFAIFLVLLITLFSSDSRRFRLYVLSGFFFTLYFLFSNLWAIGFLDRITYAIPHFLFSFLSELFLLGGLLTAHIVLYREQKPSQRQKLFFASVLPLIVSFVLCIVERFTALPAAMHLIIFPITCISMILWVIYTFLGMGKTPVEVFLFECGLLVMFAGSVINRIYNFDGLLKFSIYIFPCCIAVYILCIFIAIRISQHKTLARTRELLALEKDAVQMQTAMLSSQIKPHFLYNTLTSIQELCYSDPDGAADLIVHFSRYLRRNIDFMSIEELVPFSEEMDHIENFMIIQSARFGSGLHFQKDIQIMDFMVPPLSVEPFVENAVKYGVRQSLEKGTVILRTKLVGKEICIGIENDGPGFDPASIEENHSIANIKKRFSILQNGTVDIRSEDGKTGTLITIHIPVSDEAKAAINNTNNVEEINHALSADR